MREILFRGKTITSKEWIYGDLLQYAGGAQIWENTEQGKFNAQIIPETVGQYTGLCDNSKNGTKIFEGDIVRTKKYGRIIELKDHTYTNVSDYDTFVVCYSPCMFRLLREKPDRGFNLVNDGYAQLEVIGNIHDNPELLEG